MNMRMSVFIDNSSIVPASLSSFSLLSLLSSPHAVNMPIALFGSSNSHLPSLSSLVSGGGTTLSSLVGHNSLVSSLLVGFLFKLSSSWTLLMTVTMSSSIVLMRRVKKMKQLLRDGKYFI
jgi:hypothetical protein